jgi:hypothetical protein
MNRPRIALALTAIVVATAAQVQSRPTLEPVDEAEKCSFSVFRDDLRGVIALQDRAALLELVDPTIRISFGDINGREAFERQWQLDRGGSGLWRELDRVLALGGKCQSADDFVAPYVYANWPDAIDAFAYVAITGRGVRLRETPDPRGRVLTSLDFAIVRVTDAASRRSPWTAVSSPSRGRGFVASEFVRSSIDYRAFFHRADGRWMMTAFVSGD